MQTTALQATELSEVCNMLKTVMEVRKNKGLSLGTARECSKIMVKAQSSSGGRRMSAIADMMAQYINQELKLVGDKSGTHNI